MNDLHVEHVRLGLENSVAFTRPNLLFLSRLLLTAYTFYG